MKVKNKENLTPTKKLNGHIEVKIDGKLKPTEQIQSHPHWRDTIIQALTKINYGKIKSWDKKKQRVNSGRSYLFRKSH